MLRGRHQPCRADLGGFLARPRAGRRTDRDSATSTPIIYQLANQNYATAGFHDVTIGNNGYNGLPGFNAGPGYDQATGWGTVDFAVFANAVNDLLNPNASPDRRRRPRLPTATADADSHAATPTGGVLSVPATLNFPATATGKPGIDEDAGRFAT